MRKLVLSYYVSLDGKSVGDDNGMREVMNAIDDPEQESYYVSRLWEAGAFLMGRRSYDGMKDFWPVTDHPSAPPMNQIPKVVFSRSGTARSDDGWPARIASGDLAEQVAALKAEPGGDLVACAGDEFVRSLVGLGLVDEYRLWVLPAATGTGTPLFPELDEPLDLHLVGSRAFPSGVLELVYVPTTALKEGDRECVS